MDGKEGNDGSGRTGRTPPTSQHRDGIRGECSRGQGGIGKGQSQKQESRGESQLGDWANVRKS